MEPLILIHAIKTKFRLKENVRVALDRFGAYRPEGRLSLDGIVVESGQEIITSAGDSGETFVAICDAAGSATLREFISPTAPVASSPTAQVLTYRGETETVYDGTHTIRMDLTKE